MELVGGRFVVKIRFLRLMFVILISCGYLFEDKICGKKKEIGICIKYLLFAF